MKRKVFVLGMDGATFDLIRPYAKEGKLPNFKRVMEKGAYGDLISSIPPYTIPAWQCMLTGKNPGKLGIFDFQKKDAQGITSSMDLKADTVYEILERKGNKAILISVPGTYPPPKINGIVISGLMSPKRTPVSNPPQVAEELRKRFPDCGHNPFSGIQPARKYLKSDYAWGKASLYLMKKNPDWDFFMLVLQAPDISHHKHWGNEREKVETYRGMDEILGEFLSSLGKRYNILVVSDHGGGGIERIFHLHTWLEKEGYLSLRRGQVKKKGDRRDILVRLGITKERAYNIFSRLGILSIGRLIHRIFKFESVPKTDMDVDWERSRVYSSLSSGPVVGLDINLMGRELRGIVPEEDYEPLRQELISKLENVIDPATGERVFERIYRREEIYHGRYLDKAPDLILITKDLKYHVIHSRYGDAVVSDPAVRKGKGIHRMNGILMAYGPDIAEGKEIQNAEIIDVAPTILHMMGLPIPDDVDGKVLKEIFREDSEMAKREVQHIRAGEIARINERLKELKSKGGI